jgi:hypothetical protein
MKFTWGTGIFIFIVLFMGACIYFLVWSGRQEWSLVEKDYYPKELRHEEQLVKERNVNALSAPVHMSLTATSLDLRYPPEFRGQKPAGSILIYRPSDERLDITIPVAPDTSMAQSIPLDRLKKGRYVVKMDWTAAGKGYYQELDLYIP